MPVTSGHHVAFLWLKNYMKRTEKLLKNESIKMHFCFSTSKPIYIFNSKKKKSNLELSKQFFHFWNETFKIQFSYFRFSRIYQGCIFFLYFSVFHWRWVLMLHWASNFNVMDESLLTFYFSIFLWMLKPILWLSYFKSQLF